MTKYLIQLDKNDDWIACNYIIYKRSCYFPPVKEFIFVSYDQSKRYELRHFFDFDYEKFIFHMSEEDSDVYTVFAQCCNRISDAMIIPCFENNLELSKCIKYDTIGFFIKYLWIGNDEYHNLIALDGSYISNAKYKIKHNNPIILQIFEPFWEELQIVWI